MTKEEFDVLEVGDILTNKIITKVIEHGYDYKVIRKDFDKMVVSVLGKGAEFTVLREDVECCLDLRKM